MLSLPLVKAFSKVAFLPNPSSLPPKKHRGMWVWKGRGRQLICFHLCFFSTSPPLRKTGCSPLFPLRKETSSFTLNRPANKAVKESERVLCQWSCLSVFSFFLSSFLTRFHLFFSFSPVFSHPCLLSKAIRGSLEKVTAWVGVGEQGDWIDGSFRFRGVQYEIDGSFLGLSPSPIQSWFTLLSC